MISAELHYQAREWVQKNRKLIIKTVFRFISKCPQQDLEDYLSEAYALAAEAMVISQRKGVPFQGVFFKLFSSMMRNSVEFHVSYDAMDESSLCLSVEDECSPEQHLLAVFNDKRISRGIKIAANILSPAEAKLLLLLTGETRKGLCSLQEASKILGWTRATGQCKFNRILDKLDSCFRTVDRDGWTIQMTSPKKIRKPNLRFRYRRNKTDSEKVA